MTVESVVQLVGATLLSCTDQVEVSSENKQESSVLRAMVL